MAGFSDVLEAQVLNSVLRGVAWTAIPGTKVALYIGDPGEAGTSNEVTGGSYARQDATWAAPSGGACALSSAVDFTGMPACTVSHFGVWSTDGSPVFLGGGTVTTSKTYGAGDTARLTTATTFTVS